MSTNSIRQDQFQRFTVTVCSAIPKPPYRNLIFLNTIFIFKIRKFCSFVVAFILALTQTTTLQLALAY